MGLFDFLKPKAGISNDSCFSDSRNADFPYSALPDESEWKYYQPVEYYTAKAFEGTQFERAVITFDARKRTCVPSRNGLYVAEILLLSTCESYPNPKNGYPGYWWFQYGIRNVGNALRSLERRGFIRLSSATKSVQNMSVSQLKELLTQHNYPNSGKKAELIERIKKNFSESELQSIITNRKYELTELGRQELKENEYVPYMHRHPKKTTENDTFGPRFNVWEVNRQLATRPDASWIDIVDTLERQLDSCHSESRPQNSRNTPSNDADY